MMWTLLISRECTPFSVPLCDRCRGADGASSAGTGFSGPGKHVQTHGATPFHETPFIKPHVGRDFYSTMVVIILETDNLKDDPPPPPPRAAEVCGCGRAVSQK